MYRHPKTIQIKQMLKRHVERSLEEDTHIHCRWWRRLKSDVRKTQQRTFKNEGRICRGYDRVNQDWYERDYDWGLAWKLKHKPESEDQRFMDEWIDYLDEFLE